MASLSPPNPALRHVSLDASAYALRNPSTRPNLNAKQAKRKAEKALRAGDREEAKKILPNAISASEHPPCPRLIINDATVEKLGELLNQNANGLLLIRDELAGFLTRMEKEEFQGERALYLEAFSGDGCFTYDRIVRGTIHIQNCTLSIIGGVQPSRIAPLVRGAMSGTSNDGLLQRLQMTVWPDDICSWRWVDRKPDRDARDAFEDVFRYLGLDAKQSNLSEGRNARIESGY